MDQPLADRLDDLALRYAADRAPGTPADPGRGYVLIEDDPDWRWSVGVDPAYSRDFAGVWYGVTLVDHKGKPMGVQHLPGALATTGAAHHHGNALARAERHLAGDAIGPKRRRRYRRLLARVG